jgi:hypothetical protein
LYWKPYKVSARRSETKLHGALGASRTPAHLGHTGDHVLDEGLDGTQAGDVLARTVPDGEDDLGLLGGLDLEGSAGCGMWDQAWVLGQRLRQQAHERTRRRVV